MDGGAGDDRIQGNARDDLLRGFAGDDELRGDKGCDRLRGGTGDDVVSGGGGSDRVGGGAGNDMLYGGGGSDVFVFRPDPGADTIIGFDADPGGGQDKMDLRALGISVGSFASAVTIEQVGDDMSITLRGEGSIVCGGVDGESPVIDQSDFVLLA